jgi:alpha-galactosidase
MGFDRGNIFLFLSTPIACASPELRVTRRKFSRKFEEANSVSFKRKNDIARRDFMSRISAMASGGILIPGSRSVSTYHIHNSLLQISIVGGKDCLWSFRPAASSREYQIAPPTFNIDHQRFAAALTHLKTGRQPARLRSGMTEYAYAGDFIEHPDLSLTMLFQIADDIPIVRFNYMLTSRRPHKLTKPAGRDDLTYLEMALKALSQAMEVRFSNFMELTHSYSMEELPLNATAFRGGLQVLGPVLAASDGRHATLVAYEHGSQVPDAFLKFELRPDRSFALRAAKGNYLSDQVIGPQRGYQTLWFEAGAVSGSEDQLASAFRAFMLKRQSSNLATRKPYIFYNTWNFQERNKWWYGKDYLDSMNEERILKEIEVAHRMGIEVYVLDTGWYEKTGDWTVSLKRFPHRLRDVRDRLDRYGMKLGLWFGPTSAAVSSRAFRDCRDCVMSWRGAERKPRPVWETEDSYPMCLVSRYSDVFAERLVQLSKDIGVDYFKWDGVGQYGCDSSHHDHGNQSHTPEERSASYAFQLVGQMARIADRIAAACPDAIVDYDVTEAGRAVGLAFLSAGRFFLINNGPYYFDYDIPIDPPRQNWNIFFYKGPARTWICRSPLIYDKWIPSNLYLTHYFPDDPIESQEVNLASLILGQNGIWGDLLRVSDAGVKFISETLSRYKQVRGDIIASDPIRVGQISGSPEIHEKIYSRTGCGAVVVFATAPGRYSYVTHHQTAAPHWSSPNISLHADRKGRARIDLAFEKPGAKFIFFGVTQ